MTFELDLVLVGEFDQDAKLASGGRLDNNVSLVNSTGTNGASTGSSLGAYPISKDVTYINNATSSIAGNACILPSNRGAGYATVFNNTAFSIYMYCPVGGTINNYLVNGMQANAGNSFSGAFQIGSNKSATVMSSDGLLWLAQHAG